MRWGGTIRLSRFIYPEIRLGENLSSYRPYQKENVSFPLPHSPLAIIVPFGPVGYVLGHMITLIDEFLLQVVPDSLQHFQVEPLVVHFTQPLDLMVVPT